MFCQGNAMITGNKKASQGRWALSIIDLILDVDFESKKKFGVLKTIKVRKS
jgi:hypothetical protein